MVMCDCNSEYVRLGGVENLQKRGFAAALNGIYQKYQCNV